MSHAATEFVPLNIAVLTVSDTRNEETDTSGRSLVDNLQSAGHHLVEKQIVIDDKYDIRAILSRWIADKNVQVVLVTVHTPNSWMDDSNRNIKGMLNQFDNVRIADWEAASDGHREYFVYDGTHLTTEGIKAYVQTIRDALKGDGSAPEPAVESAAVG